MEQGILAAGRPRCIFLSVSPVLSLITVTVADLLMEQSYAGILAADEFGSGGYVVPWRRR